MTKVAICFHGLINRDKSSNPATFKIDWFRSTIVDNIQKWYPEADIFCHSWHGDDEHVVHEIDNRLKPIKSLHEPQKHFEIDTFNGRDKMSKFLNEHKRHPFHLRTRNYLSASYSVKQVVQLKKQYELDNNFTYDIVILARYDTYIRYCKHDIRRIAFPRLHDRVYVDWIHDGKRKTGDLLMIFNSHNIDRYATLYDKFNDILYSPLSWPQAFHFNHPATIQPHCFKYFFIKQTLGLNINSICHKFELGMVKR